MIYNNDRDPNDEMWEKDTTTDRTNEEYAQEQADNALASVQATEACVKADMEYIEPCTPVESIVHDMSVVSTTFARSCWLFLILSSSIYFEVDLFHGELGCKVVFSK